MCDYPLLAYDIGVRPDGKRAIKFLSRFDASFEDYRAKYGDHLLLLPCGRCPSCLKAYSKQWSVRLMLESLFHEDMCFITLTYSDENLPGDHRVHKDELQRFMKRLRIAYPDKIIRYFGCGEYGEQTHRPHYHMILFGINFDDGQAVSFNELKQPVKDSPKLLKIWKLGHVSVGEVTPESCAYVARYSLKKKITLNKEKDDSFIMMSTHPGLGSAFYESKKELLYLSDRIYSSSFHGVAIPRYFDKLAENDSQVSDMFARCKEKRLLRGKSTLYSYMIQTGSKSIEISNRRKIDQGLKRMVLLKRGL